MHNQLKLVEMLVLQVKEITTFTFHDMYFNPLELAAFYGHRGVVRLLLWKGSHLSSCRPDYGLEKLVEAVNYGNTRVVQALEIALFSRKGKKLVDVQLRILLFKHFRSACANGNLGVAGILLEHIHQFCYSDFGTAFEVALQTDHDIILEFLVREYWPAAPYADKMLLLQKYARLGRVELVKLLFDKRPIGHKLDREEIPLFQVPLLAAASSGDIAMVKLLLEIERANVYAFPSMRDTDTNDQVVHDVIPREQVSIGGYACELPAIYLAASLGGYTAVDILIRAGAVMPPYDLTLATSSPQRSSPLDVALLGMHWLAARRLIDAVLGLEPGSPWGAEDTEPWKPSFLIDIATACNNKPVVELITASYQRMAPLELTQRKAIA
jgi:hypothetical protein